MRTQEEILKKFKDIRDTDYFGYKTNNLLERLTFENVKEFLNSSITERDWSAVFRPANEDDIKKDMFDYMQFAWVKANHCRRLSVDRSMTYYAVWVWLLGDDLGDLGDCEFYGKDNLVKICEKYGWDHSQWDDGVRIKWEV